MTTPHEDEHKAIEQKALIYSMGFTILILIILQCLSFYLIAKLIEMT